MHTILTQVLALLDGARTRVREEDGFSTAELLGNAALGVVALVVIWGALRALGVDVIDMVRGQILGS